jgi:hypothetical protein
VGLLLFALAILILITALPTGTQWLESTIGAGIVQQLPTIGWIGSVISITGLIVVYLEWGISFNSLRHWFRERNIERILANRIKRDKGGIFKVIDERCEKLAQGIAARLEINPDWLFATLIEQRLDDRETLANELLIGTLFERFMYQQFGGDWNAFRPIQGHLIDGTPLSSSSNIRQMSALAFVTELNKFFTSKGNSLTLNLRNAISANIALLKERYNGSALKLLQFPMPTFAKLVVTLLIISIMLSLVDTIPTLSAWIAQITTEYTWLPGLIKWLQILGIGFAVVCFLVQPRRWLQWLGIKLQLINRFEMIQNRLERFEGFNRKADRLAFAKFAYEYGLLKIDPKELKLGSAATLNLALLKTGALWTDASELSATDPDLLHFSDTAMRQTAVYLEDRLIQKINGGSAVFTRLGWQSAADLVGEYYPYNIVDGALFLIGHDHCSNNNCGKVDGAGCPLFKLDLCDSKQGDGFKYERETQHFTKEE